MILDTLEEMTSGECRWVGRHDIHVYCHHPMVETMMPWGRTGWKRMAGEARYCVVCPDAGLEHGNWITAAEAAVIVDRIVTGAVPAAA